MVKKKVELNDEVEKLVNNYLSITDKDLNEVVNKALKYYIVNQMSSSEVKEALKQKDIETTKYVDEIFRNHINNGTFGNF